MTNKCPVCGKGELASVDDIVSEIEGVVFVERGERCTHCGEEFISAEESARTIKIARRIGVWGEPLKLRRKLSKSGRGVVLRIPSDIQASLDLEGDEEVILSKVGKNKIIVEVK
jgi:YgiT-type zinc finger domain-containing protein